MKKRLLSGLLAVCVVAGLLSGCGGQTQTPVPQPEPPMQSEAAPQPRPETPVPEQPQQTPGQPEGPKEPEVFSLELVPAYTDMAYVPIHENVPYFTADEMSLESFEYYSLLDDLGRCGVVLANVGQDLMPTEERESIGSVKPSGWQTARYDGVVDGKYLYNRCHLIGFQLTGENANKQNLITGTRYLNIEGMLPFENMVADYVKETGNHVMYRVTPVYEGTDLVARGVLMEGYSVEDQGEGICFCIYAYNVQPGIEIDYATGESELAKETSKEETAVVYVVNTKTEKFHLPSCGSVEDIKKENRFEFAGTRESAIAQGYEPCGRCKP